MKLCHNAKCRRKLRAFPHMAAAALRAEETRIHVVCRGCRLGHVYQYHAPSPGNPLPRWALERAGTREVRPTLCPLTSP